MRFRLYDITEDGLLNPILITKVDADNFEQAYEKIKTILILDYTKKIVIPYDWRISFTPLTEDMSITFNKELRYMSCSIKFIYEYEIIHTRYMIELG